MTVCGRCTIASIQPWLPLEDFRAFSSLVHRRWRRCVVGNGSPDDLTDACVHTALFRSTDLEGAARKEWRSDVQFWDHKRGCAVWVHGSSVLAVPQHADDGMRYDWQDRARLGDDNVKWLVVVQERKSMSDVVLTDFQYYSSVGDPRMGRQRHVDDCDARECRSECRFVHAVST